MNVLTFISTVLSTQNGGIDDRSIFKREIIKTIDCSMVMHLDNCPVNGGWTDWGEWGNCIGECGQVGLRKRIRYCRNPIPKNGGFPCSGSKHETVECRLPGCSEEEYEELLKADIFRYSEWLFIKEINLKYPSLIERCLRAECHLSLVENVTPHHAAHYWSALRCVKHNTGCPVPGGWSDWAPWGDCSAWCGKGSKVFCRSCDKPRPTYSKLSCEGDNCTFQACQGFSCERVKGGVWATWSEWSGCSTTCGQGLVRRMRQCSGHGWSMISSDNENNSEMESCQHHSPNILSESMRNLISQPHSSSYCLGPYKEVKSCYLKSCPVDGGWSEWEPWTQCSHGCGLGTKSRSRSCSSPPPSDDGAPCIGPVTSVKRCFIQPCQKLSHEVAIFKGDGHLKYLNRGINTRLLHLYIRFKAFEGSGTILLRIPRTTRANSGKQKTFVKLSLVAGYLILVASIGKCHLAIVHQKPIELKKLTKVLIMLSSFGASLRIDDSEMQWKQAFSCETLLPNFKAEMRVGLNFTGQIGSIYVNFLQRYLKPPELKVNKPINLYPYTVENVEYERSGGDETFRNLDELIFVPCTQKRNWTIEIVIKTASPDGLLMLIKSSDGGMNIILSFEPRRVQLHLICPEGALEVFEIIEPHVGKWVHLIIDYKNDGTYGLTVNGEQRKTIRKYSTIKELKCSDNIMIGDIMKEVVALFGNKPLNSLNYESLDGILAYIKIDDKVIDIAALPAEVEKGNMPFSSETVSESALYSEIEIAPGHQVNLSCVFSVEQRIFDEGNVGNSVNPIWLRFDTPLLEGDISLMKIIGLNYSLFTNSEVTVLHILDFTSREAVEGFYSCWIPRTKTNSGNILVTYGVTVIDPAKELTGPLRFLLRSTLIIFTIFFFIAIGWLYIEYQLRKRSGWGLFSSKSIRKRLRSTTLFEMSHERNIN